MLWMDLHFHPPIKNPSDARCITRAEAFAFFSSAVADGFKLSSSDQKNLLTSDLMIFSAMRVSAAGSTLRTPAVAEGELLHPPM